MVSGLQLTSDINCLMSYKRFTCRYNFPLCDPTSGFVYPVCAIDCENAFSLCGNDSRICKNTDIYKHIGEDPEPCAASEND